MPPIKGTTNNPNGRPPGVPNKISRQIRPLIREIVEGELDKLPEILPTLEVKDRVNLLIKLIEYIIPKADINTKEETEKDAKRSFIQEYIDSQVRAVKEKHNV